MRPRWISRKDPSFRWGRRKDAKTQSSDRFEWAFHKGKGGPGFARMTVRVVQVFPGVFASLREKISAWSRLQPTKLFPALAPSRFAFFAFFA